MTFEVKTAEELDALNKDDVIAVADDLSEEAGVDIDTSGTKAQIIEAYMAAVEGVQAMGVNDIPDDADVSETVQMADDEVAVKALTTFKTLLPDGSPYELVKDEFGVLPAETAEEVIQAGAAVEV